MAWFAAASTVAKIGMVSGGISAVSSVAAAKQSSAAGKYNQAVQERNATVSEQQAEMIEKQNEFDLARFDQQFYELQGKTKTAVLTSNVELSGSGLRVLRYNAEQAEIEKDIKTYNSKVKQSQQLEKANFARMQGQVAKQQAKTAELGYYAQAGQSLLKTFG